MAEAELRFATSSHRHNPRTAVCSASHSGKRRPEVCYVMHPFQCAQDRNFQHTIQVGLILSV